MIYKIVFYIYLIQYPRMENSSIQTLTTSLKVFTNLTNQNKNKYVTIQIDVRWLVGCFGLDGPLRQYFSLYRGRLPERGRKKREMIDERKNVQTPPPPPPAPIASAIGLCPTLFQISRTPRHWKFIQHHRTTRPPLIQIEHPDEDKQENNTSGADRTVNDVF